MDMLKHKREGIKVLSPQDLVNSMKAKDPKKVQKNGCYTLSINKAFMHIMDHGVRYESDCPYLAGKHCHTPPPQKGERFFKIKGFITIEDNDIANREVSLLEAVSAHPVPAMIEVRWCLFQGYYLKRQEEIFVGEPRTITQQYPKTDILKHAILVVGYGYCETEKLNYWIIKNSQGSDWANGGFMRVCRDSSLPEDHVPLISRASYPELLDE